MQKGPAQCNEAHQSDVIKESRRRQESDFYKLLLSVLKSKDPNLDFIQKYAMHLIFKDFLKPFIIALSCSVVAFADCRDGYLAVLISVLADKFNSRLLMR